MVTPLRAYNNRIVRTGVFHATELATNRVLLMPRPATFTLLNGLGGNTEITEVDSQGYITKVENNFAERKPTMALSFTGRNLDTLAMSINQKIQTTNIDLKHPHRQQVKRAFYEAAPAGAIGSNVVENAYTRASLHDPRTRNTLILTQQNYGTFNSSVPQSFAIGNGFARRFSSDLVTNQNFVTLVPEANYDARGLSEEPLGDLEVNGLCFNSSGIVSIVHVPICFVNPEGAGITADNTVTVNLDISGANACQPWNEYEVNYTSFCQN